MSAITSGRSFVALTVCEHCNAAFVGTGWCHDRMTSQVTVPVRDEAPAPPVKVRPPYDPRFDAAFDEVHRR